MSISPTPPGSVVAQTSLAVEGLQKTLVGGQPAIVPSASSLMVFGGITRKTSTISTNNNIAASLGASPNFLDFQIAGSGAGLNFDYFNKILFEINIQNLSGVNPLIVPPAWYMFTSIEMRIDDNPVKSYTYPQQMEDMYFSVCPRFEYESTYELLGYPVSDFSSVAGFSIPVGGQQTFILPMHYLFSELVDGIPLRAIKSNITLRFNFNTATQYVFSTSLSTTLNVTNARITASGQQLAGEASDALFNMTKGTTIRVPCIQPQVRNIVFGGVADGALSSLQLSQIRGACVEISLWLYDNGIPSTSNGRLATTTFSEFDFVDQAGQPANTGERRQVELLTYQAEAYGKDQVVIPQSVPSLVTPILRYIDQGPRLSFCQHVVPTKRSIMRHGSYTLMGFENFAVKPPAGVTFTNAAALAFYYILATLNIDTMGNVTFVYQQS